MFTEMGKEGIRVRCMGGVDILDVRSGEQDDGVEEAVLDSGEPTWGLVLADILLALEGSDE